MEIMTLIREADKEIKGKSLDEAQVAALRLQIMNSDEFWDDNHLFHDAVVQACYKLTEHVVGCEMSRREEQLEAEMTRQDPEDTPLDKARQLLIDKYTGKDLGSLSDEEMGQYMIIKGAYDRELARELEKDDDND